MDKISIDNTLGDTLYRKQEPGKKLVIEDYQENGCKKIIREKDTTSLFTQYPLSLKGFDLVMYFGITDSKVAIESKLLYKISKLYNAYKGRKNEWKMEQYNDIVIVEIEETEK
jgi:hypothetical protein